MYVYAHIIAPATKEICSGRVENGIDSTLMYAEHVHHLRLSLAHIYASRSVSSELTGRTILLLRDGGSALSANCETRGHERCAVRDSVAGQLSAKNRLFGNQSKRKYAPLALQIA